MVKLDMETIKKQLEYSSWNTLKSIPSEPLLTTLYSVGFYHVFIALKMFSDAKNLTDFPHLHNDMYREGLFME